MDNAHVCLPLLSLAQQRRQRRDLELPVVVCLQRGTSYSATQLLQRVAALSHALSQTLHIQPGDVVSLAALSGRAFEMILAIMDAGAIVAPLNLRWSATEIAEVLRHTQPQLVFADADFFDLVLEATAQCKAPGLGASSANWSVALLGQESELLPGSASSNGDRSASMRQPGICSEALIANYLDSLPEGSSPPFPQLLMPSSQAAAIFYTSGTTAQPKGVVLPHSAFHTQSLTKLAVVKYNREDLYLTLAPLFHVGGLSSSLAVLMAGGSQIILPRFDPMITLAVLQKYPVTSFIAVPTVIQDLGMAAFSSASFQPFQSVQRILVGAGELTAKMLAIMQRMFPRASVYTAYGMTEACSSITFQDLGNKMQQINLAASATKQSLGSCTGWPAPGIQVAVLSASGQLSASPQHASRVHPDWGSNPDRWDPSSEENVGEVCTRGPHLMLGYWKDEEATKKAMLPGGWLRTGDIGYLDKHGQLWLMGRSKDMIKSGGENVHASEVERVLMLHEGIAQAAVVGVPHERLGEMVAAAVTLQPGWQWEDERGPGSSVLTTPKCGGFDSNGEADVDLEEEAPHLPPLASPSPSQVPQAPEPSTSAGGGMRVYGGKEEASHLPLFPGSPSTQQLDLHKLLSFCRASHLAGFKLPRLVVAWQGELPMTPMKKVMKDVVRRELGARVGAAAAAAAAGRSANKPVQELNRSKL